MGDLLDVVTLVRDALDIPEGATAAGAKVRGKMLRARADRAVALLDACVKGEDTAAAAGELRTWLATNPIPYLTVEDLQPEAAEQAQQDVGGQPVEEFRTEGNGVLPLPRRPLPPVVGPAYLAKLWSVHPSTVIRWSDAGLLTASWQGTARRFTREAVLDFVRHAIPVRLLKPGMVVQHPEWADGMPLRIVSCAVERAQRWQVTYRRYIAHGGDGTIVEAAPLCQGRRMVLRYPERRTVR